MTDAAPVEKTEEKPVEVKATTFVTKDKWEVLALLTFGHVPEHVEAISCDRGGQTVRVFTFPESAVECWNDYKKGKKLPVDDIRDVKRADEIFKGFIRETS